MFLKAYYFLSLIPFALAIVFAGITVSKLRNTLGTYEVRLLSFAYFSLSAWILGALQFLILLASLFSPFPNVFLLDTGLWLSITQNALWASAVLSLHSKQFPRISDTLPLYKIFPIVIAFALLTYRTTFLTSEVFTYIDAVSTTVIFMIFACWILQSRLSKTFAAVLFIHGYSQWIWRSLWFTPWDGAQFAIVLAFPLWRIALLVAWIRFLSAMLQIAPLSSEEIVRYKSNSKGRYSRKRYT
jgi:hypothetical protein